MFAFIAILASGCLPQPDNSFVYSNKIEKNETFADLDQPSAKRVSYRKQAQEDSYSSSGVVGGGNTYYVTNNYYNNYDYNNYDPYYASYYGYGGGYYGGYVGYNYGYNPYRFYRFGCNPYYAYYRSYYVRPAATNYGRETARANTYRRFGESSRGDYSRYETDYNRSGRRSSGRTIDGTGSGRDGGNSDVNRRRSSSGTRISDPSSSRNARANENVRPVDSKVNSDVNSDVNRRKRNTDSDANKPSSESNRPNRIDRVNPTDSRINSDVNKGSERVNPNTNSSPNRRPVLSDEPSSPSPNRNSNVAPRVNNSSEPARRSAPSQPEQNTRPRESTKPAERPSSAPSTPAKPSSNSNSSSSPKRGR